MDLNEVLPGSIADGVLADAILIPPLPPIPPTNIRKVRDHQKVRKKPQEQAAKTKMLSVVRFQQKECSIMHSYFETQCKYLLFTKYLTSTNMPTAQQNKGR